MRLWLRILIAIVVILIVFIGSVWVWLGFNGKALFNEKIASLTQRQVTIRSIHPVFPPGIAVEGLNIDGLLTSRVLRAEIDLLGLLGREVNIASVVLDDPVIFLERGEGGMVKTADVAAVSGVVPVAGTAVSAGQGAMKVVLQRVAVRNGTLRFKEKNGKEFVVENIQAHATNVPLSLDPVRTDFFVTASLAKIGVPFVGNFVKASGWLNWAAKDMDATAQAVDDNGHVGLEAHMVSAKNDMRVEGKAKLSAGQQTQASGKKSKLMESVFLGVLETTSTDIDAQFSFETKMDRFEIGPVQIKGNFATGLNSELFSGTIVKSLKAAGEELLKDEKPSAP